MSQYKGIAYGLLILLLALTACSTAPPDAAQEKEPAPPPEPIDGQTAFFRMYNAARMNWSNDAQGLRLESIELEEVPSAEGKYGAWRAAFVSPSQRRTAVFNYSVVEVGGKLQQGVFQDHEEGFTESRTQPWPVSALKTSSAQAVAKAKEQEQAKQYMAKNPDMPIMILLEQTHRHPNLAWRIVWGTSVSTSGFSVFVDASTGAFLEVMR